MRRQTVRRVSGRGVCEKNFRVVPGGPNLPAEFVRTELRGAVVSGIRPVPILSVSLKLDPISGDDHGMKRNAVAWAALVVSAGPWSSSRGFTRRSPPRPKSRPRARRRPEPCPRRSRRSPTSSGRRWSRSASSARRAPAPRAWRPDAVPGLPEGPHGNLDPKDFEEMFKRFFGPRWPAREAAVRPGCRGDRVGIRLRRQGPHPDQ